MATLPRELALNLAALWINSLDGNALFIRMDTMGCHAVQAKEGSQQHGRVCDRH